MIVSLPSILMNAVFGLDGTAVDMENPVTLQESYNEMSGAVSDVVDQGYNRALEKVEQIIQDGGYDYDLSMEALINYARVRQDMMSAIFWQPILLRFSSREPVKRIW